MTLESRATRKATTAMLAALCASSLVLAGCSPSNKPTDAADKATEEVKVSVSQTPEFQADQAAPVTVDKLNITKDVEDPGLHVKWKMQSANYGNAGGTIFTLLLTNQNDMALPPSALGEAKLKVNGKDINKLSDEESGIKSGLDLPLGSGATTNIQYAFNTSLGNLGNAELTIGNVTWKGNLNV